MKAVLFCGGLGTRLRDYAESVPKPLVPIGNQPVLWHVMNYYSEHGVTDFILCLGYKANSIKEYFVSDVRRIYSDLIVSDAGRQVQPLSPGEADWRITLIDTGVWRNIGERLWTVRHLVEGEEVFCANYSDGLTDLDLSVMTEQFLASDKIAAFLAVRPPITYHFADIDPNGRVVDIKSAERADMWINGGYFLFRREIFDYMREGEELVVEPFQRLIAEDRLMAFKHHGFFRAMDTLRDRQVLEDMVARGDMPWRRRNERNARPKCAE